ncbi:hypothetical protein [Amycolatopsis sp. NPDC059021]|uniref:hypothetical protein n=1 Tax=Amycolatopsis sp. NPDC059021 TaxID=3346704 RepID=UPI00366EF3AF
MEPAVTAESFAERCADVTELELVFAALRHQLGRDMARRVVSGILDAKPAGWTRGCLVAAVEALDEVGGSDAEPSAERQ